MANPKQLLDVDDYYRMYGAGLITEDDHVELVEGEIVTMAAKGSRHVRCVRRLTAFLYRHLDPNIVINVQDPVRISGKTELEPDLAILRPRDDDYAGGPPDASDVLLPIEVSDTTLPYDQGAKLALYAKAGVPEYWVVNLPDDIIIIETYSQPVGGKYRIAHQARRGDTLTMQSVPDLILLVDDILT